MRSRGPIYQAAPPAGTPPPHLLLAQLAFGVSAVWGEALVLVQQLAHGRGGGKGREARGDGRGEEGGGAGAAAAPLLHAAQ
jgi:hypothetical protein